MEYRSYPYRWVILTVFFLLVMIIGVQWLTFAPVERDVRAAYGVSSLAVDLLSIIFMVVFLVMCVPASWVIDRYGIRIGIGFGAALTGVFGLAKGLFAEHYAVMVVSQIGLGVAQPFILNAMTAVAAKWFPAEEKATAVGLGTLAQFLGFIIVNVATPRLVQPGTGSVALRPMLMIYGVVTFLIAVAFLVLIREAPPTPPSAHALEERLVSRDGWRHLFSQRDIRLILILFFLGLGMFNAVTTCIDQIAEAKGLSSRQAGTIMGAMFAAGIIGAIVMPPISDKMRRRKPFLLAGMVLVTPGILGMTLAHGYGAMLAWAALLGFFLLGTAGPIGFQYGAEVGYPAPEALSQGLVLLAGQVSGILFVVEMNLIGMQRGMVVFVFLCVLNIAIASMLRESPIASQKQ